MSVYIMEKNDLKRVLVECSYNALDNSNYIERVYYETETERAVKFTNQTSENYFWIPKSMIKQGWKKDTKLPQDIKINYYMKLYWYIYE